MIALQYIIAAAVAGGIVLGGAAGGAIAYAERQGRHLAETRLETLTIQVANAELEARGKAEAAQLSIDALTTDLAHSWRHRETVHVETVREVAPAASASHVCLSPRVAHGLRRAQARLDANRADPGIAAQDGADAASGADRSAGRSHGASERGIALWAAAVMRQYADLRERHRALVAAVVRVPGVEVVDDEATATLPADF